MPNKNEIETENQKIINMEIMQANLRIPDAIKDLPKYEGSRHGLHEFIQNVEEILSQCEGIATTNIPYTRTILRAIRNKIVGEANEVLIMYGTELAWDQIKNNLITHYTDKRDETNLIRDLHRMTQNSDTVEKYFSRIIDIQNSMTNFIKLNTKGLSAVETSTIIRTKRTLYEQMCLAVFLAGLREPLGSMIRAMQPTDLPKAFSYCLKEQNIGYLKKPHNEIPISNRIFNQPRVLYKPNITPPQPRMHFSGFTQYPNIRPQHNTYYNHRPLTNFNRPFQNNLMYSKPPAIPPRKPIPMDTTSNMDKYAQPTYFNNKNYRQPPQNQYPNRNYQFKSTGPPRIHSEELYNAEELTDEGYYVQEPIEYMPTQELYPNGYGINASYIDNPDQVNPQYLEYNDPSRNECNYYPSLDHEIEDENFHHKASLQESDT